MTFPADDSLCEYCGYALRDLSREGNCPECGRSIAASDPVHRDGLPWQRRQGIGSLVRTVIWTSFFPAQTFRRMCVGGHNWKDRHYLLLLAVLTGLLWEALTSTGWLWVTPIAVLALTYIEVLGVVYFSRREGWRVPWGLAERVACYAAVGWLPAAAAGAGLMIVNRRWRLTDRLSALGPIPADSLAWIIVLVLGCVCILGFETLVWLGVRKVRYANAA